MSTPKCQNIVNGPKIYFELEALLVFKSHFVPSSSVHTHTHTPVPSENTTYAVTGGHREKTLFELLLFRQPINIVVSVLTSFKIFLSQKQNQDTVWEHLF